MAQPIKQINKLNDYFSKEITAFFDYFVVNFVKIYGVSNITPESFLFVALENKDCICYKVINTILNDNLIDVLHDKIGKLVDYNSDIISGKFDICKNVNFKKVIEQSISEMDNTNSVLITTDHILLSILKLQESKQLCELLRVNNIAYENTLDTCKDIHGVTNDVYKKEKNKKELEYKTNRKNILNKRIDFCTNLISEIEFKDFTPTFGRKKEINQIFTTLLKKNNNNVLLVGEKGVGKTQCVCGVAENIWKETAPVDFHNKVVWKLNTAEIFAGTGIRGSLEEKVLKLVKQLSSKNDSILFIDDIYSILGNKHSSGEIDNGSLFNNIFSNNNIQIICTCTYKELKSIKDNFPSIVDNFQQIEINKFSPKQTVDLLNNIKGIYEDFHNIILNKDVLEIIVNLCDKYIIEKALPSSAIEVIDEIGADNKINSSFNKKFIEIKREIRDLEQQKDKLIKQDNIEQSEEIDDIISKKKNTIADLLSKNKKKNNVTIEDVYKVFSAHVNMPVSKLNIDEKKYLKTLETILKSKIIGQDESIIEVCNAIKRNKVGLSNNNHPSLTALLIGPTGVGKTLLAKVLAKDILGDEKYLVRFDMSEYTDETSINKLIGSSAGYVGYNDGGVLTEAIKRNKYCVLLLDEIEKAHPKVFNLFLQILDEGFLTDNMGQKVDFKNTYILMTSNVGTKKAYNHNSIGFNDVEISTKQNIIEKEMKNTFPPEFLNRFDNILFFKTLTDENLKKIIVLELKYLQEKLEKLFYTLKYNDDLIDCILDKLNNDKNYGARPIKRIIKNEIENQIADLIINNEYEEQHVFNLFVENKNIMIK